MRQKQLRAAQPVTISLCAQTFAFINYSTTLSVRYITFVWSLNVNNIIKKKCLSKEIKRGTHSSDIPKMSASLKKKYTVLLLVLHFFLSFGSVYHPLFLLLFLCSLGDVYAVKVIGSKRTVALGALSLSGVVTHLQTFVAENMETLGENGLLVSRVAAGAT